MWKPWLPGASPVTFPVTLTPAASFLKWRVPSTLPSLAGCSTATACVTGPPAGLAAGLAGGFCSAAQAASPVASTSAIVFMEPP